MILCVISETELYEILNLYKKKIHSVMVLIKKYAHRTEAMKKSENVLKKDLYLNLCSLRGCVSPPL